jgi:hypothetical protein
MANTNRTWAALAAVMAVLVGFLAIVPESAAVSPQPNSAVFRLRVFNDCPTSILNTVNNYPAQLAIDDANLSCAGFANLHVWRFSTDGTNPAVFNNNDGFSFGATLTITGTSQGEAGLQICPWFSQDVDGRLNVRTTDGEVACFGGRLPFYNFTAQHGVVYQKGTPIGLAIKYLPNGLSMINPGTIEYTVNYNGQTFSSGVIPFDEGNPNEPFGTWGILNDARVGGHHQPFLQNGNPDANLRATFDNIVYEDLGTVAVEPTTWGGIKATYSR